MNVSFTSELKDTELGKVLHYGITTDSTMETRARMFFTYTGNQLYNQPNYGLMATTESSVVDYDDWYSTFRPPRIDDAYGADRYSTNFNAEIRVPLKNGTTDVEFCAVNGDPLSEEYIPIDVVIPGESGTANVSGWSLIYPDESIGNPTRVLIETLSSRVAILDVSYVHGLVTVKTKSKHNFKTGDAITITGIPNYDYPNEYDTRHHVMGYNGERYMGTFTISVVDNNTFTYNTAMYGDEVIDYYDINSTARAEKWDAVVYNESGTLSSTIPKTTTGFLSVDNVESFLPGDKVIIVTAGGTVYENVTITSVNGSLGIRFNSILAQSINGSCTVYYAPRVPSASIPVNYQDYSFEVPGVGILVCNVNNTPKYAHMVNTFMTTPMVDTFFDYNDGNNHSMSTDLVVAPDSFSAFKFNCGYIPNARDDDATDELSGCSAELRLYVTESLNSRVPLVVRQMSSDAWTENMVYSEVKSYITNNILASRVLENPSMSDGDIGFITFTISPSVVAKWLNGSYGYSPTISLETTAPSAKRVVVNSFESDKFGPLLVISGGEKAAVKPDTIPITVANGNGDPGDTLRIYTGGGGTFSEYTYNNIIKFGDIEATVVSGTKTYIDVVIPYDIIGKCDIVVYAKQLDGTLIQLSDPCPFYVNGELSRRDIKLSEKIEPGVNTSEIYRSAVYNRDLSYSNYTEVTDENSLIQNIYSCILTTKGERLFNPEFGTTIEERLYAVAEMGGELAVLRECIAAVNAYEPRVTIVTDRCRAVFNDDGALHITLGVQLPSGNVEELDLTFTHRGTVL